MILQTLLEVPPNKRRRHISTYADCRKMSELSENVGKCRKMLENVGKCRQMSANVGKLRKTTFSSLNRFKTDFYLFKRLCDDEMCYLWTLLN